MTIICCNRSIVEKLAMPAFDQAVLPSILAAKYVYGQEASIHAYEDPVQSYTFRYTILAVLGNTVARPTCAARWVECRWLPESIRHLSLKLPKKSMADKIKMLQDKKLAWNSYLYRGLGSINGAANSAVPYALPFNHLRPGTLSTICAQELGSGIYLTPSVETAIDYAGSQGAIFVFKRPQLNPKEVNLFEPTIAEWKTMLAANSQDIPRNSTSRPSTSTSTSSSAPSPQTTAEFKEA